MLFRLSLLTVLLTGIDKAISAQTNFSLYAYGTGIKPGLQLFYGDGQAYVGYSAPSFVSEAVNVTLSETGDDAKFVGNPERAMNWPSEPTMYINMKEGAMEPVGFFKDNETLPDGSTMSGFGLYGGWAFHKSNDSSIEMNFLATPTNETDVYLVKWNAGGTKSTDDISIALRTMAPVTITV